MAPEDQTLVGTRPCITAMAICLLYVLSLLCFRYVLLCSTTLVLCY